MLLILQGDILLETVHLEQKILHGHYTRILLRGFLHAWNQLLLREDLCRFGNSTLHGGMFGDRRLPLSFFAVQILGLFSLRVMHQNIDSAGTLAADFYSLS